MRRQEQVISQFGLEYWRVYFEDTTDVPLTSKQYEEIQEAISNLILKFRDENNTRI